MKVRPLHIAAGFIVLTLLSFWMFVQYDGERCAKNEVARGMFNAMGNVTAGAAGSVIVFALLTYRGNVKF